MLKQLALAMVSCLALSMPLNAQNPVKGDYGYLYCHMSDRGEWTAYAVSRDGYHYQDILGGNAIFNPDELAQIEGGTRDAYITRSADTKKYLMVTTDMCVRRSHKWDNYGINLLRSKDLIHWESTTFDFRKGPTIFCDGTTAQQPYKDWSTINRVWAPQIFWDPNYTWSNGEKGGYMIYYSMLNRPEEQYDRMYYSHADRSFTKITTPKLLFDWGYATIDADINYLPSDGLYHMLIKKEGGKPGIYTATSKHLTYGWGEPDDSDYVSFEGHKKCEGSSAFQLIGDSTWRVAYIQYSDNPKHYRICKADAHLRHFSDPVDIEGVTGPQHGSFMRITKEEYERLIKLNDTKTYTTPYSKAAQKEAEKWIKAGTWRNGFTKASPDKTVNATDFQRQYTKNKAQWDALFAWVQNTDLTKLSAGSHPIPGTTMTASVQDDVNLPIEKRGTESHRKKIDFQYVVSGTEGFALIDHNSSKPNCNYDAKKDVIHYNYDKAKAWVFPSVKDHFNIFFPGDWHVAKVLTKKKDQHFRVIVVKMKYMD